MDNWLGSISLLLRITFTQRADSAVTVNAQHRKREHADERRLLKAWFQGGP